MERKNKKISYKPMEQKHPHFDVHNYDKSYTAVRRSFKLKPNEKALISHIITWQEQEDEKGNPRNLECFESNSTLSDELGIPFDTLEKLIKNMKKKYNFFTSTPIPGKGKSRNGGNFNRTIKRIDMVKLAAFLKAEKAEREQQNMIDPIPTVSKETSIVTEITYQDIPELLSFSSARNKIDFVVEGLDTDFSKMNEDEISYSIKAAILAHPKASEHQDSLFIHLTKYISEKYPKVGTNQDSVLTVQSTLGSNLFEEPASVDESISDEDQAIIDEYIQVAIAKDTWPDVYKTTWVLQRVKGTAEEMGFLFTPRHDRMDEAVKRFCFARAKRNNLLRA